MGCTHTHEEHDEMRRDDARWAALPFAYHWTDEFSGQIFEARHCREVQGSTLSRAVRQ